MKMVPLGDVASIERRSVSPSQMDPATLYVGLEHIERGGRILGSQTLEDADVRSGKFEFTPQHVLYGKLRPGLGKIARPQFAGICSTDILPVRPSERLDRDYLVHYLRQPALIDSAAARASGANLPRLSPQQLAAIPIPLPGIEEQRRIAGTLDQADAIRAKRRQVLAHLDSLTQSIFHDMFGNRVRTRTLRELGVDFLSGKNVVGVQDVHPTNRVLKVSAISSGIYDPSESKPLPREYQPQESHRVRKGDILFGRASGSLELLGATAVVDQELSDVFLPDKVWRLEISDESPLISEYVLGLLRSGFTRSFIQHNSSGAAGVRNISKAKLLSHTVPVPGLDAQLQFATRTKRITGHRAGVALACALDDELFASLQSRAFRGEL